MAKQPAPKSAQKSTAVATVKTPGVPANAPAYLKQHIERTRGMGYSHAAEDSIVPFVSLIQQLSPQLKKNNEKFLKGAEFGDILLKGAVNPLVKSGVGLKGVQQCGFQHRWVEWVPRARGGGFVAQHVDKPADCVEKPNPEDPTKFKTYRKNGNELLETRYHFVLLDGAPYVIPFVSTGHTVSKGWTTLIKAAGDGAPSFAMKFNMTPVLKTKGDQEWFIWQVTVPEDEADFWATEEEFLRGEEFAKAILSGKKVAEEPDDETIDNDHGV